MSALTKKRIREYLVKSELSERLVVTPLLDYNSQVKDTSIDLRLGPEFIITKRSNFPTLDPTNRDEIKQNIGNYQEKITIDYYKSIILHPNQFLLGATFEYIALPPDLCAYVIGRSSWGRLGLIIATATFVNPGFKGSLTLELANVGEVPLKLFPGTRICQLILHTLDGAGEYTSRYLHPVGPEFGKVHEDTEIQFWGNKKDQL